MKEKKQGFAVWITGLPASGKSTLTAALTEKLAAENIDAQVLESDAMRPVLAPDLGYEPTDREKFYHLLVTVGELLVQNGVNVIFDATGAERRLREEMRGRLAHFIEVHVQCPLEMCQRRDPKRIYEKAKQGVYTNVPGIHVPYEPPLHPEVEIDTTEGDIRQEAETVMVELRKRGLLKRA